MTSTRFKSYPVRSAWLLRTLGLLLASLGLAHASPPPQKGGLGGPQRVAGTAQAITAATVSPDITVDLSGTTLDDELVGDTLSVILKYEADIKKAQKELKEFVQLKRTKAAAAAKAAATVDGDEDVLH